MYKYLALCLVLTSCAAGVHEPDTWNPFQHEFFQGVKSFPSAPSSVDTLQSQGYHHGAVQGREQCEVYKVGFTQDLYFQYIQYKTEIPDIKQFTLCYWSKFYNHSNDHPIFSYAVDGQPKAIHSWISNTERSSYFSMAVEGHTFYRLNYPLRLNRWYHTCQSWNGKTGEWQVWVNAERVGRGFHNRLVGHVIPGGGIAITGQAQSQLGGGFQEGAEAPKGSGGMLGEITMVQFYSVALTAGKAHKDHKHHHAHQFDHNGRAITTQAPTTPANRPILPTHPLLTGGQINPNVKINLAAQTIQGQQYDAQFLNGQFVGNLVTQQLSQTPTQVQQPQLFNPQAQLPGPSADGSYSSQFLSLGNTPVGTSGFGHSFLDNGRLSLDGHDLFKRQNEEGSEGTAVEKPEFGDKIVEKREADSKHEKRQVSLGSGLYETPLSYQDPNSFDQSLLYGLAGIGQNEGISQQQKQEDEREPAEAEVKAVLNVCNGCDEEPFDKALIFAWRTVPKKLYSGAFYSQAVPECKVF